MKLNGGNVDVSTGTGFKGEIGIPLVVLKVEQDGTELTLYMTPGNARRIGLDFISGASSAWADAAVRAYAKEHGIDGDGIIGYIKTMIRADLDFEEGA